ncbi:hypothetical protein BH11ARM2_BH11ARM2_35840 [soil metagenome]
MLAGPALAGGQGTVEDIRAEQGAGTIISRKSDTTTIWSHAYAYNYDARAAPWGPPPTTARHKLDAEPACDHGNEQACQDIEDRGQGNPPPMFVDGKACERYIEQRALGPALKSKRHATVAVAIQFVALAVALSGAFWAVERSLRGTRAPAFLRGPRTTVPESLVRWQGQLVPVLPGWRVASYDPCLKLVCEKHPEHWVCLEKGQGVSVPADYRPMDLPTTKIEMSFRVTDQDRGTYAFVGRTRTPI